MDKETIKKQINDLFQKEEALREQEKLYVKAQGLDEEINKAEKEIAKYETRVHSVKEDLNELKHQKAEAVRSTLQAMQDKITSMLPEGKGIVNIEEDGSVRIGWMLNEFFVPYAGLSGGEKALFDPALSYALLSNSNNKILIYEAAELDKDNLTKVLRHLSRGNNSNTQVIVNTCHRPDEIPEMWNVIDLERGTAKNESN